MKIFHVSTLLFISGHSSAFLPSMTKNPHLSRLGSTLFEEDLDMVPVAKSYIHAKYKQVAASHGHAVANKEDVKEVLHSVLPPVTPEELEKEEAAILNSLLAHKANSPDAIDEDDFVESIMRNSYWKDAGDIVVKELMYFDSVSSTPLDLLCFCAVVMQIRSSPEQLADNGSFYFAM